MFTLLFRDNVLAFALHVKTLKSNDQNLAIWLQGHLHSGLNALLLALTKKDGHRRLFFTNLF
ncbi:hypothetical protein EAI91_11320 [Lacticaseibacillus paracasei]|uniref:Uncharacterized protein n=1 Tax=Lacticaseibacillus paracasei subsp. paracasei Lpp71 TaxID=1256207 RepID=A0A8E0IQW6_LACPA|nr:hypothetical protein Lpp71_10741 [Lacticaseibacillus paracasei subsp. paracasei Lpp71]EPD08753.1 hypothetical protein Lpp70_03219 [Lacticaseibacillus paracasei subsp. paracasei Lpp70]KAB7124800.1 hypothetical protein GBD12_11870 [Bifidobacterium longum]MCT3334397.1 hypothetical protein [Lacticaseibacillus paracasei]PTS55758.1 hypothetical protein DBQ61_11610 [Lactobacillus sp. DS22_6]